MLNDECKVQNCPRTDCFAYHCMAGRCTVLLETYCTKEKCSFYKTEQQYREDREKYIDREIEFRNRKES